MIRNNGITNVNADTASADEESSNCFLLFDYFDVLYCKVLRGGDKKYLNYLSIENVFEDAIQQNDNYKVSYKTLSLYCKSDVDERRNQDFFWVESIGEYLSNIPFLGIIQITLCKENYIEKDWEKMKIDEFLSDCEDKIWSIAYQKRHSKISRLKLFRSSTTSDFCLAIRTDSVKEVYDIAIALNGSRNVANAPIKMMTFTNVGIECRYTKRKGYAILSREFLDKCSEMTIALRFSADRSQRKNLQEIKTLRGVNISNVKGLFGRYEYLIYIDLWQYH